MRRALLLAALSALGLCSCGSCDSTAISPGTFVLKVDKPAIEFGNVFIGAEKDLTVTLRTEGSISVAYTSSFEGDAFGYSAGPAMGDLAPNAGVLIKIAFRPAKAGTVKPRLRFLGKSAGRTSSTSVQISGTGVMPPDCDDGNGCTIDSFNLETGQCEHKAERISCDDFNACTMNDTCVQGVCLGEPVNCDDHDVCTDDLCDKMTGCVHILTAQCDDHNPCTADTCDPMKGCQHSTLADGTPCDNGKLCTYADICLLGSCIGVNSPDGTPCDDGDPCSAHDRCTSGMCQDPTFTPPQLGDLFYATDVGPLAEGASQNPIIDRDGTTFVGIEHGIAAVDRCGALKWKNTALGETSRWSAAVSLPGILVVPMGSKIVDVDTQSGLPLRTLDLKDAFPPGTNTASTATASVRILDLALRASGGIIASLVRETITSERHSFEGTITEIDRTHSAYSRFRDLGALHASRLAVDSDEAVVAILRADEPDKGIAEERLVRFGLDGLPDTTWSTSPVRARHGEIAFAGTSHVLWTAGLISVERDGRATTLLEDGPEASTFAFGSPVLTLHDVVLARPVPGSVPPNTTGFLPGTRVSLLALDPDSGATQWNAPLAPDAEAMSPLVDSGGHVYLLTSDGRLHAFDDNGGEWFTTALPIAGNDLDHAALGISQDGVVVAVARGRVFGVQSMGTLGSSSWPRHRRDNLSTGHR